MDFYVSIYENERKKWCGRDFTLNRGAKLIETDQLINDNFKKENLTVILHATDVRDDSETKNGIIEKSIKLSWRIFLFTNGTSEGKPISNFQDPTVYKWDDIAKEFPNLPPKRKSIFHLIALSILCQGYLAAHGKTEKLTGWNNDLKKLLAEDVKTKTEKKDWWKPALGEDYQGTAIQGELEVISGNANSVSNLRSFINAIKNGAGNDYYENVKNVPKLKSDKIGNFSNLVESAYTALKSILKEN